MRFQLGDRVKITRTSQYYYGESGYENGHNPSTNVQGTIYEFYNSNTRILVRWDNNNTNSYSEDDLELVRQLTSEELAERQEDERLRLEAEERRQIEYIARLEEAKRLRQEEEAKALEQLAGLKTTIDRLAGEVFDNYEIQTGIMGSTVLSLICKFDEVVISNSQNRSETIKDFFLIFHFKSDGRLRMEPCGFKQSFSHPQWESNYTHSHLPGIVDNLTQRFCLGYTTVATLVAECEESFDEDNISLLFYSMKDFIKWESLEGGPHSKIESIGARGSGERIECTPSEISDTYQAFISKYTELPISFVEGTYVNELKVLKESQQFKDMVTEVATKKVRWNDATKEHILRIVENPQRHVDEFNRRHTNSDRSYFSFKGEPIKYKMYNTYVSQEELSNLPLVAHPDIVDWVAKQLEKELNKFVIDEQYSSQE